MDDDMLLMTGKGVRGRICHVNNRYTKANNKYMKYCYCLDVSNLYGYPKSQKLLVDGFKWVKNTSKFNEDFTKDCHREINKEYILKDDVESVYRRHEIHSDLPLLTERMKIGKLKNLKLTSIIKKSILSP